MAQQSGTAAQAPSTGAIGGPLLSADNHLHIQWLPRNLWLERLPSDLREKGPRVVETDAGSFWFWEGQTRTPSADGSSHGTIAQRAFGSYAPLPGVLPPSQPQVMLSHLDLAGVEAAVFYGETRKWAVQDPSLRTAMYRVYNDFCLELSAAAPGRLLYLPNLSSRDPHACLAELQRLSDRGVRAVEFGVFDLAEPLASPVWEPLWQAAESMGVVLCSHTGHPAGTPFASASRGAMHAHHATSPFGAARPIAEMVFSGVFERHPALRWVMAECRIGWLPFLFSWMDRQVQIRQPDTSRTLSLLPSDYVRRNVCFTFEDDWVGASLIPLEWSLLADTVMWGMDYPHPQGMWPSPRHKLDALFADLDPVTRHEILYGRAASLYGLAGSIPLCG